MGSLCKDDSRADRSFGFDCKPHMVNEEVVELKARVERTEFQEKAGGETEVGIGEETMKSLTVVYATE